MKEFIRKEITVNDIGYAALFPVNDSSQKFINKLSNGEFISCEVKEIRNYQQLKMFWACCNTVSSNARRKGFEQCDTKEAVAEYVKLRLGYVDFRLVVTDIKGKQHVHIKTKSISYAKMTQEKWKEFFDAALIEMERISTITAQQIQDNAHHYETDIADDR